MIKKITPFFFCIILSVLITSCMNKSATKATKISDANTVVVYNWVLNRDKNNPEQVRKILNIIEDINFEKLNALAKKNNKEPLFHRPFYKCFYNYNAHTTKTIENIFIAREKSIDKNEFDELLYDLYKKDNVKPIIDSVTSSNSRYNSLLNNILKSENEAYLVYDWGSTSKKHNPDETKKVLDIIGNVDFNKISDIEQRNNNHISYYFYDYPYHNFNTIKNIFDAKTYGVSAVEFDSIIYALYKKDNIKPIIDEVVKSNPKYKRHFKTIENEFDSKNGKWNYPNILYSCFFIAAGVWAKFKNTKNIKFLSSPHLINKTITNKDMYLKYCILKLRSVGIILIILGVVGVLISNSEFFYIFIPMFGFIAIIIAANYFEYKMDKYSEDKNM